MPLISKRMRWLQVLYPPAEAAPPNPGFLSDDLVAVVQADPGTTRLQEFQESITLGGLGSTAVTAVGPSIDKYWFVFGASIVHDDPTNRPMFLGIRGLVRDAWIVNNLGTINQQTNVPLSAPRAFILPPRCAVRGESIGMGGAQRLTLEFLFLECDIGEPPPPSP